MVARQAQDQASICNTLVGKGPGDDACPPAEPEPVRDSGEEKTCWDIQIQDLEQADPCFADAMASWRSQLASKSATGTAERQSQQVTKARHAEPDAQGCGSESKPSNKDDFLMACSHGTKREVQELLQDGADPDWRGEDGDTGLHRAIRRGRISIAALLAQSGCDLEVTNSKGQSALMSAVAWGHKGIVCKLLRSGANAACTDSEGSTPLHAAATRGDDPRAKEDRASLEALMARVASDRETNFGQDDFNATFLAPSVWKDVPAHKAVSLGKSAQDQRVVAGYVKGAARGVYRRKYLSDLGILTYSYLGEFYYNELGAMVGHELNCCHA
eukprot:jgi/Picsp_1/6007/NSC_03361-R1_cd4-specific ankyrin repeat protein